jgi:hypothetical protein
MSMGDNYQAPSDGSGTYNYDNASDTYGDSTTGTGTGNTSGGSGWGNQANDDKSQYMGGDENQTTYQNNPCTGSEIASVYCQQPVNDICSVESLHDGTPLSFCVNGGQCLARVTAQEE